MNSFILELGFIILIVSGNIRMQLQNQKNFKFINYINPDKFSGDLLDTSAYNEGIEKHSTLKNKGSTITSILSQMPDSELIKLLLNQPANNEYDLETYQTRTNLDANSATSAKRFEKIKDNIPNKSGYFRLENQPVNMDKWTDSSKEFEADQDEDSSEEKNRENMFDMLVAQLKKLCFSKSKPKIRNTKKNILNLDSDADVPDLRSNEHMFLITNDEIRSNDTDDLTYVDPDSLNPDSNVLVLGPLNVPLTDDQLKLVMSRVTGEISRPEYNSLLNQLASGKFVGSNAGLLKHFISGPQTRRFPIVSSKENSIMTQPKKAKLVRCGWLSEDTQYVAYHDDEWGHPQKDSVQLFRMLCLEGQQAGLAWITILKKRERYDQLFHDFDPVKISKMNSFEINKCMSDPGIVRHRGKIESIVNNAKSYMEMEKSGENFSEFLWSFVQGEPIINNWKMLNQVPTQTDNSVAMSKELKKRKFKFIGPTICYAFMQACGLVNDHIVECICHPKHSKTKA